MANDTSNSEFDAGTLASIPEPQARMKPLFIAGPARSGTTILASLLDGHPEILVWPFEFYFFTSFWGSISQKKAVPFAQIKPYAEKIISPFNEKVVKNTFSERNIGGKVDHEKFLYLLCNKVDDRRTFTAWSFFHHLGNCYALSHTDYRTGRPMYFAMKTMALGIDWSRFDWSFDGQVLMTDRPADDCYLSSKRKVVEDQGKSPSYWFANEAAEVLLRLRLAHQLKAVGRQERPFQRVDLADLKRDVQGTLRLVMDRIGVAWHDCLATPTFLGNPFGGHFADSSLNVGEVVNVSSKHGMASAIETILLEAVASGSLPVPASLARAVRRSVDPKLGRLETFRQTRAIAATTRKVSRTLHENLLERDLVASRGALTRTSLWERRVLGA